jgi:hypothetical protein
VDIRGWAYTDRLTLPACHVPTPDVFFLIDTTLPGGVVVACTDHLTHSDDICS